MDGYGDFIQCLEPDMSMKILMYLEDPADLVRASTVSSLWRQFVITNGLSKHLCIRMFPEMSSIAHDIEANNIIEPVESLPENSIELACLQRDHRVYAFLVRGFSSLITSDCILKAIGASSTDNYPEESIRNTLERGDRVERRASYWSSKGSSDPTVPEALLYKLISNLCVITEIHLQPFQAFFQFGFPIYSATAVRFRMGHPKFAEDVRGESTNDSTAAFSKDKFVWTYTSPQFPMAQENRLQKFELPEPVLCIGGILLIELLGRVQRQAMDGLYYICIAHVEVVGRPLLPPFDVEMVDNESPGEWALKYYPEEAEQNNRFSPSASKSSSSSSSSSSPSRLRSLSASIRGWLLGGGPVPPVVSLIQPPNVVSHHNYDDGNGNGNGNGDGDDDDDDDDDDGDDNIIHH